MSAGRRRKFALSCLLLVLPAGARADGTGGDSSYDPKFVQALQQTGAFDLEACELAQTKAVSPEVQSFAAAELKSRSENVAALKLLVEARNLTFPSATDPWKRNLDKLTAQSGPEFDQTFLTDMLFIRFSDRAVAILELKVGRDDELKALADKIDSSSPREEATITGLMEEAKRNGANPNPDSPGN